MVVWSYGSRQVVTQINNCKVAFTITLWRLSGSCCTSHWKDAVYIVSFSKSFFSRCESLKPELVAVEWINCSKKDIRVWASLQLFILRLTRNQQKSANSWAYSLSICKFLRGASPQFFMINPQISTKYCTSLSQNSPKVLFVNFFYVQIWIIALYATFVRRKSMYLRKF